MVRTQPMPSKHTYQLAYGVVRICHCLDLSFKYSLFLSCEWCKPMLGKTAIDFSTHLLTNDSQSITQVKGAKERAED